MRQAMWLGMQKTNIHIYMIFELADTMVIQNNEIVVLHLSKTKP